MKLILFCFVFSASTWSQTAGDVWTGGHAAQTANGRGDIRIVTWNIERGLQFDGVSKFLESQRADLLLLQEVDVNARRSGNRRVHEELAKRLGMQYALAPAFEELGQRTGEGRAYQGQAVLARARIAVARSVRFEQQSDFWRPRWYLPNWSVLQRRVGGRLALVAEVVSSSVNVVVINVHLESRGPESLRLSQMKQVLREVASYPSNTVVVLAGDLNVSGVDSPVIHAVKSAGFRVAAGGEVTTLRGAPLDWIFVRGECTTTNAKIHREVSAADHYPVSVTISPARSAP